MSGLAGGIAPQVATAFCDRYPRIGVMIRVQFIRDIMQAMSTARLISRSATTCRRIPACRFWKKSRRRSAP